MVMPVGWFYNRSRCGKAVKSVVSYKNKATDLATLLKGPSA